MAVLRRRDRQIAFRVSEEEYRVLQAACLQCSSRSVSDLVRKAALKVAAVGLLDPVEPGSGSVPLRMQGRLGKIENVLELLLQELSEIRQRLGSPSSFARNVSEN